MLDVSQNDLKQYVLRQLNYFFPDNNPVVDDRELNESFSKALLRIEYCFRHIIVRGYSIIDENGVKRPYFQHTNSDQYCQFLWFLSNTLWTLYPSKHDVCDKIILLNKALHGCWYTYKVNLPNIFILVHPVGSVIGHARYSDYLVVCQNVTIGERRGDTKGIGKFCFLSAGSTIMGDGEIGDNVSIGVNTIVYKEDIESNSIVYIDKISGQRIIKRANKPSRAHLYFVEDEFCH